MLFTGDLPLVVCGLTQHLKIKQRCELWRGTVELEQKERFVTNESY